MMSAAEQEARVVQLIRDRQYRDAAEACDQMNQQYPDYESGWYTASHLAMLLKEPILAVRAIDRALVISPGRPEWLLQRVECLGALGDLNEARITAEQISGHLFQSAEVSAAFAFSLSRLGLYEDARRQYAQAIKLEPEQSSNYYNLATVERFLGDAEAAQAALTRCLALDPDDEDAHFLRAGLKTQTDEDNNVDDLQAAYIRAEGQPPKRVRICYALSKELEDMGDYDRSFEYLSEGSSLRRSGFKYTLQNDLDAIQSIRETYSADVFDGRIEGHVNAEPIFVIGMPRTGTTLVERILSSHSVVQSAGELSTFSVELAKHCQRLNRDMPEKPSDLVPRSIGVNFEELGAAYIASARPKSTATAHFIDKLPLNFLYAGLIHLALPKAKIVLLERDPMDAFYAVYKTLFEGIYPFSYGLTELGEYFLAYRELIDHWQTVMPGVVHVVKYEDLVTEPKPVVENLLSYCGLSYEEACLKYYENNEAVTTASAVQVRDNFFQSSIGKWRNYEKQLAPVAEMLGIK